MPSTLSLSQACVHRWAFPAEGRHGPRSAQLSSAMAKSERKQFQKESSQKASTAMANTTPLFTKTDGWIHPYLHLSSFCCCVEFLLTLRVLTFHNKTVGWSQGDGGWIYWWMKSSTLDMRTVKGGKGWKGARPALDIYGERSQTINPSMGALPPRVGPFGDAGWPCIAEHGRAWLGLGPRGSSFGAASAQSRWGAWGVHLCDAPSPFSVASPQSFLSLRWRRGEWWWWCCIVVWAWLWLAAMLAAFGKNRALVSSLLVRLWGDSLCGVFVLFLFNRC